MAAIFTSNVLGSWSTLGIENLTMTPAFLASIAQAKWNQSVDRTLKTTQAQQKLILEAIDPKYKIIYDELRSEIRKINLPENIDELANSFKEDHSGSSVSEEISPQDIVKKYKAEAEQEKIYEDIEYMLLKIESAEKLKTEDPEQFKQYEESYNEAIKILNEYTQAVILEKSVNSIEEIDTIIQKTDELIAKYESADLTGKTAIIDKVNGMLAGHIPKRMVNEEDIITILDENKLEQLKKNNIL